MRFDSGVGTNLKKPRAIEYLTVVLLDGEGLGQKEVRVRIVCRS